MGRLCQIWGFHSGGYNLTVRKFTENLKSICVMIPTVFRLEGANVDKLYKRRPNNPDQNIESDISARNL